jgi:hypothetical protein
MLSGFTSVFPFQSRLRRGYSVAGRSTWQLFESNSQRHRIQRSKAIMNNQPTLDKAGTSRRLKIMNNEAQSIYGLLVDSEEKGRSRMETAVYATCILSVVVAICQFIAQPTPTPFGDEFAPEQPVPVMSQHAVEAVIDTKS